MCSGKVPGIPFFMRLSMPGDNARGIPHIPGVLSVAKLSDQRQIAGSLCYTQQRKKLL